MRKRLSIISLVVILGLVLIGLGISPVLAAPQLPGVARNVQSAEVSFTGRVLSIYAQSRTLDVEVNGSDGQSTHYTVQVPDHFDLNSISAGDYIEVRGTPDQDGLIIARTVAEQGEPSQPSGNSTQGTTSKPAGDRSQGSIFCRNQALAQPMAAAIAKTYGLDEEQVMNWFCEDNAGIGQIILALQTARATIKAEDLDADQLYKLADDYLSRRSNGEGWGQIWQDLGYFKLTLKAHPAPKDDSTPKISSWLDRLGKALKVTGLGKLKDRVKSVNKDRSNKED